MPNGDDTNTVLINALREPTRYDHPVESLQLLETHISWVILTGPFVYKIKKPVDLGFLDFTTLDKRRHYCEEELRLNRRLAPELYLAVVAITGEPHNPELGGSGEPIEYAVKMRQFDQQARLDQVLDDGGLHIEHMDMVAMEVAQFHQQTERATVDTPFGTPERVHAPVRDNFQQIRNLTSDPTELERLTALSEWAEQRFHALHAYFHTRREEGFVRECHGDMHLSNMAFLEGEVRLFDCIEFNEYFRWIDIQNEIAFMIMDLDYRGHPTYAHRFLDTYLQYMGDYEGLVLSDYYRSYRAMVRAKVAAIRLSQPGLTDAQEDQTRGSLDRHIALAEQYMQAGTPALIITHGLSGSGKTTGTQPLVDHLGAIRIRSDIERKRLHGLDPWARTDSGLSAGIYTQEATRRTYQHLGELARTIIETGYPVIVDATFLAQHQRQPFLDLAHELHLPFAILDFQASEQALRERVSERSDRGTSASEAGLSVLEHQLAHDHAMAEHEQSYVIAVDTEAPLESEALSERVRHHLLAEA